jgi:HAD superfamily hydrolase (TIGR01509 family)
MEKTVPTLATTMLSRYDAVLLDIDGTLVDSNGAHASAWSDAFEAYGRHHAPEQVRPLIGKGGDKLLRELASLDDESGEGKRIAEARVEIFRDRYLPSLKPTPGAAAFVEWLLESRMRVVVATSAREDEVKALLRICGGLALVKDATTSDDAERSKPDPDILVAALEKSGATPDRAIMIGDTPYDIEAASRAGLATIAFRCGGWDDATLQGAIAIYDHPRQLMDSLGQSPHVAGSHLDNATEGAIRMARLPNSTTRSAGPLLGALGALGLTLAFVALRRPNRRQSDETGDKRKALATYLRDHLAGADTAIQTVQGLRDTHRGPEGALFKSLCEQFREDRGVVEGMLVELGYTSRSAKRLAGRATGSALRVVAGGAPGDLSLFRTLEALAIGVQGKRCLWRAAQALVALPHPPGRRTFVELEADAVRQWEAIERHRRSLVPVTFGA